jgi:hypothetical protein
VLVYGSFSLEEVEVVVSSGVRVADRRQRWLRRITWRPAINLMASTMSVPSYNSGAPLREDS